MSVLLNTQIALQGHTWKDIHLYTKMYWKVTSICSFIRCPASRGVVSVINRPKFSALQSSEWWRNIGEVHHMSFFEVISVEMFISEHLSFQCIRYNSVFSADIVCVGSTVYSCSKLASTCKNFLFYTRTAVCLLLL